MFHGKIKLMFNYKVSCDAVGVIFYVHVLFKPNMNIENDAPRVTRHFITRYELNFAMKYQCKNDAGQTGES